MFNLVSFYFKTFFKSAKNLIPMALLSLLIIGYCVSFNVERSSRPDYSIAHFPTLIQHAEETQIKINNFQNEISMAYSEQDWKTFYDKTIKYYQFSLDNNLDYSQDYLVKEIARYKFLQKENIPFIEEGLRNDALLFLKYLLFEPIVLLILVIVLISSSQIFSSEIENKTYKILYTQPISKTKILISKLLSIILINFVIIFSTILLCFLYQWITKDLGYPNFLLDTKLSGGTYITLIKYVLYEVALLSVLIVFTCCIGVFISLLINNSSASICVSTVLYGLLYILFRNNPTSLIQKYNPCAYLDIDRLLCDSPISKLDLMLTKDPLIGCMGNSVSLENIELLYGIFFFSICIIFMIFVNVFLINKKRL